MFNDILSFMKNFLNGYRIVSTGDLTVRQINSAREDGRLFVDEHTHLGWVALPWNIPTVKDTQREIRSY